MTGDDLEVAVGDGELWRRAMDGEPEVFGELFDRHAKAVYNFVFRRIGSWSDAEDLTSLVFLHAWRRRADVVLVHDSALPWLFRTADFVVRNERRRQRFRWLNLARQTPATDEPDHADQVAAQVDDEREASRLRTLLRKLPRHEQEIVELCFWSGLDAQSAAVALDVPLDWSGLDAQSAAVALDVPLGTVKSRLSRARKRLRDLSVDVPEDEAMERLP